MKKWTVLLFFATVFVPVSLFAEGRNATRYPIVLSHHWSGTAEDSFRGDDWDDADFTPFGVKKALESEGAIVYQPDKTRYGSHEIRGKLLYRRCAGETLKDRLCEGDDPRTVDGVEAAMLDYCGDPKKRGREYRSFDDCIDRVKINVICHSQGCSDSRYMISKVTNRLTGKPMSSHVASWTSVAGANKGTSLADKALSGVKPCDEPECKGTTLIETILHLIGVKKNGRWVEGGYESLKALTRKYMTQTMDLGCDPKKGSCPPSFNEACPNAPSVYYQTYSGSLTWIHPCNSGMSGPWQFLSYLEGPNDGLISVDSQKFTTTGFRGTGASTGVTYRGHVRGEELSRWLKHPGISHMGFSNARVPGMGNVACGGKALNQDIFYFSREGFYQDVVEDLKNMGF